MKKIKSKYIYSSLVIFNIGIASCFSILTLNKQNKSIIDINKDIKTIETNIPVVTITENKEEIKKEASNQPNKPIKKSFSIRNCDFWDWSSWGYSKYRSCFK